MATVSPFARSSVFDEPRLGGREQTVSRCVWLIGLGGLGVIGVERSMD